MEYTLTYRDKSKGWQSFYSYVPEKMLGMNNYFYTFKNGALYRHNTNEVRNSYYGVPATASITGVINEESNSTKTFKTFVIDSTIPWDCTILTDLDSGFIDKDWFTLKEGNYFAHIRRNSGRIDLDFRSAQGIGILDTVNSTDLEAVVLGFTFDMSSRINEGDILYKDGGGSVPIKLGLVESVSGSTIIIDTTMGTVSPLDDGVAPLVGDFILSIRDSIAESYGATGYYLRYTLESSASSDEELFSIGSNLFKSNP